MSARVNDPTRCPATVGVKVTVIVQFEAGVVAWSVTKQLLLATAKSPLAVTDVIVRAAVPVFVTVSASGEVATPTG